METIQIGLISRICEWDKLTQSILAKAFHGELVPPDPNDEPASEHLNRIRNQSLINKSRKEPAGKKKRKT
jgi:type I restriction enzyme, S subunit